MKIKVYIITYKKTEILNKNLSSLYSSTKDMSDIDVTVISNYPSVEIYPENKRDNLRVIINTTRMPNAWGYLSRDWNFCILDAFYNYSNPNNTDWVVLAQNDVTWCDGWDSWVRKNKKYDFLSQPRGDQSMLLNIDCVKKVGFFDERFSQISYQENDYFRRCILTLGKRCSINDDHYNTEFGKMRNVNIITKSTFSGCHPTDNTIHNDKYHELIKFLYLKYDLQNEKDRMENLNKPPIIGEINWYPFFWWNDDKEFTEIKKTFLVYKEETKKETLKKIKPAF